MSKYRHTDKAKKLRKIWFVNNANKIKFQRHKKYIEMRNCESPLTQEQWELLLSACDYKCFVCGSENDLTKDHITPISKGGKDEMNNILVLCRKCNGKKSAKGEEWYKEKLLENIK